MNMIDVAAMATALGSLFGSLVMAFRSAHERYAAPRCVDVARRPTEREMAMTAARAEVEAIERAAIGAMR